MDERRDSPDATPSAQTDRLSPRARIVLGASLVAFGAFIMAIALRWIDIAPTRGTPSWIVGLAGGVFALGGVAVLLPQRSSRAQDVVGALLFSAFAAIGLWVGFGPGERQFSGSVSVGPVAIGSSGGEGVGRFMFGAVGVLIAIGALFVWRRVFRRRDDDRDA